MRQPDADTSLIETLITALADHLRTGGTEDAAPLAARLAVLAPHDPRALRLRGTLALHDGSRPEAAEALLAQAAARDPADMAAHANLAVARRRGGDLAGAATAGRAALALDPGRADLHFNLANLLKDAGRAAEAEALYCRAVTLDPALGPAYANLGILYRDTDRLAPAMRLFRRALTLDRAETPADVRVALADTLDRAGRRADALACLDETVRRHPDHAVAHWNRSLLLLRSGDLRRGWRDFEWRWRLPQHRPRRPGRPAWTGRPMPDATVLIHAEQGYGDTLMFCRWLPAVAARVGHVVLACPPGLVRLMTRSFPAVTVVTHDEAAPASDAHAPLMSLPLILGVARPIDHAGPVPYLRAAAPAGAAGIDAPGPRVGLVWSGGPGTSAAARSRSIPFAALAPLWAVPGVSWVSLQVGDAAADLAASPLPVIDMAPRITDFADTADIIAGLDLVISIDTSVAHLAGALGAPTWILLKAGADWRWFLDRDDSPWYPTATLIRQTHADQWGPVIATVAQRLRNKTRRTDTQGSPAP